MPARRRTARSRRSAVEPDAFLYGDGLGCLLSGVRLAATRQEAEVEWERMRAEVWDLWLDSRAVTVGPTLWPPHAARHFDGLTSEVDRVVRDGTGDEVALAAAADLAAVDAFRSARPVAAEQCAEGLAEFVADVRAAAALAERWPDPIERRGARGQQPTTKGNIR